MDELPPRLSEVANLTLLLRQAAAPKGATFTRLVKCLVLGGGGLKAFELLAGERYPADKGLEAITKAAVQAGSLTNLSALAPYRQSVSEFLELARPSSIVLRLDSARRVPFRVSVPKVTSGGTPAWVGEGVPKPATALALDAVALEPTKLACIVIITEELARLSSPSADAVVRQDLIGAINSMVDSAFISSSAATSTHPAGILNGVTPVTSTGTTPAALAADLGQVAAAMLAAGGQLRSPVLLINPAMSLSLGLQASASAPVLPRTIVSASVAPTEAILLDEAELLLADDGDVEIDTTRQASVMMDSAPVVGTTDLTSLWQHNYVGIRAERTVNWAPAHAAAATAGVIVEIGS